MRAASDAGGEAGAAGAAGDRPCRHGLLLRPRSPTSSSSLSSPLAAVATTRPPNSRNDASDVRE